MALTDILSLYLFITKDICALQNCMWEGQSFLLATASLVT